MLRQLELFGFKSFADRTAFEFAPGITCVVGPNGSGKSNVVDAIKWILGDQSPRSLRGKEMADVIFNGSAGRKPSGFAEAALTFDNSGGVLSMDAREVRIGRRLYRSGDSEYLLNGAVVRLKDVRDLLMGTGAGTSAYSIIEQGRVDQVLQANPTTRRVVFEEAAGISRYKARKVDAERKLERVAQNLLRLTDIVDEVATQLNATRSQASKAAKYRELSQQLRELWTGLAADEYRNLAAERTRLEAESDRHRRQFDALHAELASLESARAEVDAELASVESQLRSLERRASSNREAIAAHESTIRHETLRHRELEGEIAHGRQQRNALQQRARAVVGELAGINDRLQRFESALHQQQQALRARETRIGELSLQLGRADERIAEYRSRLQQDAQSQAQLTERTASLAAQLDAGDSALRAAEDNLRELERTLAAAQHDLERSRCDAADAAELLRSATGHIERIQDARLRLVNQRGSDERSLAALREQRSAWEARLHVLADLERRQEGLGVGVREILHRAATARVPPWDGIVGCVGELLDVPLKHAALLEVALANRAQLIVVQALEPLAEYLNNGDGRIVGRVGFIAVAESVPAAGSVRDTAPDLSGLTGVIARADQLAAEPEALRGLAARLLADTWIVETLDDARRLASGSGGGCRFVTLQGELLDADGVLYAGTVPNETAVLSRRSELRQLKLDLQQLDREITAQLEQLAALRDNLHGVDDELSAAEVSHRRAAEAHVAAQAGQVNQAAMVQRIDDDRQRVAATLVELHDRQQQTAAALSAARTAASDGALRMEDLQASIQQAERESADIDRQLSTVREQTRVEQLELAKHEERVLNLRSNHDRLVQDQALRVQQEDEAQRRLVASRDSARQTELRILATGSAVAELALVAEELASSIGALASRDRELRTRREQLRLQEDRLHGARRDVTDRDHACEIHLRDVRHQMDTLAARLEEEYQLALPDLVAGGASAYRGWLEARTPAGSRKSEVGGQQSEVTPHDGLDRLPADTGARPLTVEETVLDANTPEAPADADLSFGAARAELDEEVQRLRRKLKLMGNVNTDALRDLDELEARHTEMSAHLQDLQEARTALEDIIRRINLESRRLFLESFEAIRGHFRELFRKLFGGGEADIILEDPADVLECGIDIVARPPGKELRSISLLSGGEKTLTAVALLFAMFKSKPSPYCILDEVDASLDEANVDRYVSIVRDFTSMTQFVVITHRKPTMAAAHVLYGVTMEQAGVSKRMSVRFEDVKENGEIRTRGGRAA